MTATAPSARERLLTAADELFYAEGVRSVGIDRVIEQAGVAKATLYSTFGSKDELIQAYLGGRHDAMRARMDRTIARHRTPRTRLLAPFEIQAELAADPDYRGCAFSNANAEGLGPGVTAVVLGYRAWVRGTFAELARDTGVADPDGLAVQLHLLWDGGGVSARSEHDVTVIRRARAAAEVLLDAAL